VGATYDTIRDKIARGALPRSTYTSASMGHGLSAPCDGCDEAVVPADTEVTVEFPGGSALRFHLDCFGAWRVASSAVVAPSEPMTTTPRRVLPRREE